MKSVIGILLLLTVVQGAAAMSIFDVGKVCVFSSVKARLMKGGEPLSGVRVTRRWHLHEEKQESVMTDSEGFFEFPALFERSIGHSVLPMELVVGQAMFVELNGEEIKFWSHSKVEPEENSEFDGKMISLSCDMNNESKVTRTPNGSLMGTLCTWEDFNGN